MCPSSCLISCKNCVKTPQTKQQSTCNLAYDCLRDPAIVEESFDLFFHQVAVSPVKATKKPHHGIRTISRWLKHQPLLWLTLFTGASLFLVIPKHLT